MATQPPDPEALRERANELYWDSDRSVNQIGEDLGLSKGVLYGLIEPLPAGLPCPACGTEMVFPNRTARDKGFVVCEECGMEEEEAVVEEYWSDVAEGKEAAEEGPLTVPEAGGEGVMEGWRDRLPEQLKDLGRDRRVLAGTALLGVAAGIVLGTVLRRR